MEGSIFVERLHILTDGLAARHGQGSALVALGTLAHLAFAFAFTVSFSFSFALLALAIAIAGAC